jgi:hypothetical protein
MARLVPAGTRETEIGLTGTSTAPGAQPRRVNRWSTVVVTGVIGFAAVVLVFAAADLIAGRPMLYTPALLGGVLFYGVRSPSEVVIASPPILAYTAVHLLAFLVLGAIAAGFASIAARHRHVWFLLANVFMLVLVHASGVVLTLTESLQGVVSGWLVGAATAAAAAAMAAYLLWANPPLRRELGDREYRDS